MRYFLDKDICPRYNTANKSVEAREISVTGEKRGNVPVKGLTAEIRFPVSAGIGLVLGRICPGLSQYVECSRGL